MSILKIGDIKLKNRLFLAPMVDVTDCAFRLLCREQGASIAYTEMLYTNAILHENKPTLKLMTIGGLKDRPLGLQITGNNISEFTKLSKLDVLQNYDLIDINCGCPSVKIVGSEAGSYLLKDPDKIADMIRVLKDSGLTVTAKIRLGYKINNVIEISRKIEKAGADLLTIHARTSEQKNSEPADWSWISKVKREIGIPIVGNGGVVNGKTASEMLEIADGAMVASAAIGNPFVFREILRYLKNAQKNSLLDGLKVSKKNEKLSDLKTGKEKEITKKERIVAFSDYLNYSEKFDVFDISRVKYLGANFLKGFDGASALRNDLMKLKKSEDILEFVKQKLL